MSELESSIEAKVIRFCIDHGIRCTKLRLASESAWPDRTLLYKGRVMFLELKRKGEKPTAIQLYVLNRLAMDGFQADWADNLHDAIRFINDWKEYVDSSKRLEIVRKGSNQG